MGRTPIPADLLKSIPNRTAVVTGLLSVLLDDKCPVAVREWAFLQGHRLGQQEKAGEPFSTNNAYEQFLKVIRSTD